MNVFDVVMRLNGPIRPVGDSRIDSDRLENLKALCDLTEELLDDIRRLAEAPDTHLASVKQAKNYAAAFLASAATTKQEEGGASNPSGDGSER